MANVTRDLETTPLNVPYAVCEIIVAIVAVVGNALVLCVFQRERKLRRRTNYYIVSLAAADLLVGLLGIPFAVMASVGLPKQLYACLFTVSLLVVLCTISIFCLVAVSVDRYWAILHPMGYSRNVRTKTAIVIIGLCWLSGSIVGFLPLFGWYHHEESISAPVQCIFTKVMDYNYLVFLYFATIVFPAVILAGFYTHIYQVVVKQLRRIVTMNPSRDFCGGAVTGSGTSGGVMLRVLGAAQKREVKATQNLSIIVLFFIFCWFPLYTINCIQAFCSNCEPPEIVMNVCIILSHLNSAGNPLLYAYHLRDFRAALKTLLCSCLGSDPEPPPPIAQLATHPGNAPLVNLAVRPSCPTLTLPAHLNNFPTSALHQLPKNTLPLSINIESKVLDPGCLKSAAEDSNKSSPILKTISSGIYNKCGSDIKEPKELNLSAKGRINSAYFSNGGENQENNLNGDMEIGDDDVFEAPVSDIISKELQT